MTLPVIDYMKDENGDIKIYDSFNDAELDCGMYELDNVWICKLVYNYIERE